MPKEPVCPTIPGITFPTLPDLDKLGEIKDDALEDVNKLSERVKNPPSAKDLMEEIGTKVSDEAEKAAKALEKAAMQVKDDIEKQLAEQWQKAQDAMTEIEKGVEALADGSAIKEIGAELADIPLAAVGGAFAGFKNALECLEGAAGSAKAEFTKVADALGEDLENGGRGLSATAADEAITSQTEDTTDENGNKVRRQKTISPEEAAKNVEGTTKTVPPTSSNAIVQEKDTVPQSSRINVLGSSLAGEGDVEVWGRKLTESEKDRLWAVKSPAFVKLPLIWWESTGLLNDEEDTLETIQAKYDETLLAMSGVTEKMTGTPAQRREQARRDEMKENWVKTHPGEPIPAKLLVPVKLTTLSIQTLTEYQDEGNTLWWTQGKQPWHGASYDTHKPPVIDGSMKLATSANPDGEKYLWLPSGKPITWQEAVEKFDTKNKYKSKGWFF